MTHHETQHDARRDGSVPGRLERLLDAVNAMGGQREQRREILVERAEEQGLERPDAEQAYDIAREEGLEPSYGLAVMLAGLSIEPIASPRPDVNAADAAEPEWVDTPPDPKRAARELRLRQTFRRLRSHLGDADGPDSAVRAFGQEPDLESYDY